MSIIPKHLYPTMNKIFNFQFVCFRTRLNNILRHATLAAAFLALPTHALAQSSCPADLNGDRVVNSLDMVILLNAFGNCPASPASCPADLNGDGVVNALDVIILSNAYGNCPVAVPTINDVSPATGPTSGGTTIVILGTNFTGTSRVQVGGIDATRFEVLGDRTVTAVTPAGTEGLADVTVTAAGQTATRTNAFTYTWYTVLEQNPSSAVVPNATVRANIIATGFPWRVRDIGTGIELLLVPPGTFTMGCNAFDLGRCHSDESPRHQVTLTRAFYLGKYEVTQAEWQARMGSNPSRFRTARDSPSRPVEQVSWNDVAVFNTATGFRLPTEAEWEYSCRAGTTKAIHQSRPRTSGSNSTTYLYNIAWWSGNAAGRTHAVGGKDPNGFGFYDMSGNVSEWCNDWFGDYSDGYAMDPAGPSTGRDRVRRGGGWGWFSSSNRSSSRDYVVPGASGGSTGFRAARTP